MIFFLFVVSLFFFTHDLKIGVICYSDVDLLRVKNENAIFHFDNIKLLYIFPN